MSARESLFDVRLLELRSLLKTALDVAHDLDKIGAGEGSRAAIPGSRPCGIAAPASTTLFGAFRRYRRRGTTFVRPAEDAERRALAWLMDVRTNEGPLERGFAATIIATLAHFEEATKG